MIRRIGAVFATLGIILGSSVAASAQEGSQAESLKIVVGSSINLVAREAAIPFTVENSGLDPAEVTLRAEAASFRIQVLSSATATIPGQSSSLIEIPVRAIANGSAAIRIWLEQNGERVGPVVPVAINVNYDLEAYLLVTFGVAVILLMVVGAIRTGVRLRARNLESS